jgi:hypothetical protein
VIFNPGMPDEANEGWAEPVTQKMAVRHLLDVAMQSAGNRAGVPVEMNMAGCVTKLAG